MTKTIDYGNLMHNAMRGLIRRVLDDIAKDGLPGDHHFFITLDTTHPEVEMADWLCDRYPEEITIVIQHWFDNLVVTDDGFSITLNFGDSPEPLHIPYDAIRTFVDPSVEFGLRFETQETDDDEDEGIEELVPMPTAAEVTELKVAEPADSKADETTDDDDTPPDGGGKPAEVVSLDQFRK